MSSRGVCIGTAARTELVEARAPFDVAQGERRILWRAFR